MREHHFCRSPEFKTQLAGDSIYVQRPRILQIQMKAMFPLSVSVTEKDIAAVLSLDTTFCTFSNFACQCSVSAQGEQRLPTVLHQIISKSQNARNLTIYRLRK